MWHDGTNIALPPVPSKTGDIPVPFLPVSLSRLFGISSLKTPSTVIGNRLKTCLFKQIKKTICEPLLQASAFSNSWTAIFGSLNFVCFHISLCFMLLSVSSRLACISHTKIAWVILLQERHRVTSYSLNLKICMHPSLYHTSLTSDILKICIA